MKLHEALIKAGANRRTSVIFLDEHGDYQVAELPGSPVFVVPKRDNLPLALTSGAQTRLDKLLKDIVYGSSPKLSGAKIKRRRT